MPPQPAPAVRFPPPNHNVRSGCDALESDDELKGSIRRRIQEAFSSIFESARQRGIFSDERAAPFLDWLRALVEEISQAELARDSEHRELHEHNDSCPVLLRELVNRLQRVENIISGFAAAFQGDVVPSSSRNRPRQSPLSSSSNNRPRQPPTSPPPPAPRPNPGPNPTPSHSSSRHNPNLWHENERRRMQESSNFRAIAEAVHQIESDRQRQWSNWRHGGTIPPVPIGEELEEILNRITRAAVL